MPVTLQFQILFFFFLPWFKLFMVPQVNLSLNIELVSVYVPSPPALENSP